MENLDYLSDVFLPQRTQSINKQITWIFFLLPISWIHVTWHLQEVTALKEIKRAHHFVLVMTRSLCDVLLFYISLVLTSSSLYLSLEIYFPEICLIFYVPVFHVTLKLLFSFYFNENCFLEWSRYLFNSIYIVRSSLVILYPCR